MKKIKWYFIAVAFIAIASAFATKPVTVDPPYHRIDATHYIPLDLAKKGVPGGWDCINTTPTCTYKLKAGHSPNGDADFDPLLPGTYITL